MSTFGVSSVLMAMPPGSGVDVDDGRWMRSGVLDGGDLELERDLVAHQETTGLERGVPGHAVVAAVDRHGPFEAQTQVAERVGRRALVRERDRDRVGHALDGQVADQVE